MMDPKLETEERLLLTQLGEAVASLSQSVERLNRTIQGDLAEGNEGILPRLRKVERGVERLYWAFPLLVTGGTAIGQVLAGWLGL